MPPLDWTSLLSLAPSLATSVLFAIFIFRILERQDKRDEKRDLLDSQRELDWKKELTDGRKEYVASVKGITDAVISLSANVKDNGLMMMAHDAWDKQQVLIQSQDKAETVRAAAEAVKVAALVAAAVVENAKQKGS